MKAQNYFNLIFPNDFFYIGNSAQTFVFQIWKTGPCDTFLVL